MYTAEQLRQAQEYQTLFIEAFADILAKGLMVEFEDYIHNFRIITRTVWRLRNSLISPYPLEQYQKYAGKLINACINSNITNSKILGLKLIACIYEELGKAVQDEGIQVINTNELSPQQEIHNSYFNFKLCQTTDVLPVQTYAKKHNTLNIFTETEFFKLISFLNIKTLQETILLPNVLYYMILVDMALFYDQPVTDEVWKVNPTVKNIHAILGTYIVQTEREERITQHDYAYWALELSLWYKTLTENIEQDLKPVFAESFADCISLFTCGLLYAGCFEIVEEGLYKRFMSIQRLLDKAGKKVIVAAHAFIYYLIKRESKEYTGEGRQERARNFWVKNKKKYQNFIDNNSDISELLIGHLNSTWHYYEGNDRKDLDTQSQWLYYLLQRFDYRKNSNTDYLLLQDTLDDFCVFTLAYMNRIKIQIPWTWAVDAKHNIIDYLKYIKTSNNKKIMQQIEAFTDFMEEGPNNIQHKKWLKDLAYRMYNQITVAISNLYKEKIITEAKNKEKKYNNNRNEIQNKIIMWKKALISEITNTFKDDIYIQDIPASNYHLVKLLTYSTYTDLTIDALDATHNSYILGALIDSYIEILKNDNHLINIQQTNFTEEVYLAILKVWKTGMMLGSEYLLKKCIALSTAKFQEVTNNFKWITNFGCSHAAAIKNNSVIFYISDLKIEIKPGTVYKNEMRPVGNLFEYEPIVGVDLLFENDRLEEYVSNERKEIIVTAKIAVKVTAQREPIGFYFTDENRGDSEGTAETTTQTI